MSNDGAPMKRKRSKKPYSEMTTEELAEATADLDEQFVIDKFGPPPPEAQALWQRAKRKKRRRP